MSFKISIIVPVYNVEKYLSKCLESIINQTYNNLEIILVNDNSTDRSGEICDNYKLLDNRIRVIHNQKNEGISVVRNIGLEAASGEFIGFVDSDDWIEQEMFEKLVYIIESEKADIVQCGYKHIYENGGIKRTFANSHKVFNNNEDILEAYFLKGIINSVLWNKIYRKELFKDIKMVNGRCHEDTMAITELLLIAQRVIIIEDELYNYLKRSESIMTYDFTAKKMDKIFACEYIVNLCVEKAEKYVDDAKITLCMICIYLYEELEKSNVLNKEEFARNIINKFKENYNSIRYSKSYKKTRIQNKLLIEIFNINKVIAINIYRIYDKIKK